MSVLRSLPLLLLLIVGSAIGHGMAEASYAPHDEDPRPRSLGVLGSAIFAPDSTVIVGARVYGLKGTVPGDSLLYQYSINDTVKYTSPKRALTALSDSGHALAAPAYGKLTTYKGAVYVTRVGTSTKYLVGGWTWAYTRGPAPTPSSDSVGRLAAVRLPLLLPRLATVCPPGYSCAFQAAPVQLPRYVLTRLAPGHDSLALYTMQCARAPSVEATGLVHTGCIDRNDGQVLGLLVCAVAELADGRVVWTSTSAAIPECPRDASTLLAARYGARWAPTDPTSGPVVFTVSKGTSGLGIMVDQPTTGLSLSLAVRS